MDCPEVMEPTPGMQIRPRPALRRLFANVAIDLSRTYFDAFVDKLAQRVESAGGGNSAAGQERRMISKVASGVEDESAEGFWRSALGDVQECSWLSFEGALRTFLADDQDTLTAVLVPLEGAICDHRGGSRKGGGGTVSFSALAATFAGGNFKDTLRAMAAESSADEIVFDIVVRIPVANSSGTNKEYDIDEDRSTSFVMIKSSDTLSRVRQTIVEAFMSDDYGADGNDTDSDAGLEFLGESNFSFVFQVGAGNSGKNSGAVHWARSRRQQERKVTAVGLTNLCVVEDDTAATTKRRWARVKKNQTKREKRSVRSNMSDNSGSGSDHETSETSGSERSENDDEMAGMSSYGDASRMVTNPVEFALAAGVLHQAKVRAAEGLTTSDVMADGSLSTAMGSEQSGLLSQAAAELKANPSSSEARANLVAALPNDVGAVVAAGGKEAAIAAADAALQAASDLATPLADLKTRLLRAPKGKSARSDGRGGKRERLVIIGGGFAGCTAAARLDRRLDRHPNLHVTLVDTKE